MRYLLFAVVIVLSLAAHAEMYRWVDEKGKIHFSDKPLGDKAKAYEPPPLLTIPAQTYDGYSPINRQNNQAVKYQNLKITSPANDRVFTPDQTASISISVQMNPGLQTYRGHKLGLYLNGQLHAEGDATTFNLDNLSRGSYSAYAAIMNENNKPLIKSSNTTFHVQKHHR